MAFQFNGLKAQVTITGSVGIGFPSPTTNQSIIQKSSSKAGQNITAGTGLTLYTVTAGKSLYVSSMNIDIEASNPIEVRDGSGGTLIACSRSLSATGQNNFVFPTPIKFTNSVFIDVASNSVTYWTITGWEE